MKKYETVTFCLVIQFVWIIKCCILGFSTSMNKGAISNKKITRSEYKFLLKSRRHMFILFNLVRSRNYMNGIVRCKRIDKINVPWLPGNSSLCQSWGVVSCSPLRRNVRLYVVRWVFVDFNKLTLLRLIHRCLSIPFPSLIPPIFSCIYEFFPPSLQNYLKKRETTTHLMYQSFLLCQH